MAPARLLLVDDDESVRSGLKLILEAYEFDVTVASNVNEALKRITSENFDVLVSDLHMPGAGDGLTVVSAMRHANPTAVTLVLSANPDMAKAAAAILRQTDDVMLKPPDVAAIVEVIQRRLANSKAGDCHPSPATIATILERETSAITQAWLVQMERAGNAATLPPAIHLTIEQRCEHLLDALHDIIFRLRYPQPFGTTSAFSMAALQHGSRRRRQGIGAATLGEEARALQMALFQTIQKNLHQMDMGELPSALMTIADEINAQLQQSLAGYENEQPVEPPWGFR